MRKIVRGPHGEVLRDLLARGWEIERRTGSGHLKLVYLPNGGTLIVPTTSCSYRGARNMVARARRIEAQAQESAP